MDKADSKAVYPIGIVAELTGIHPRSLRIYEQQGLICPARRGGKRFFSENDLRWIECLNFLLNEKGLDPGGVKELLLVTPCWLIRDCSEEERRGCPAVLDLKAPCWEINSCCGSREGKCHECTVYAERTRQVIEAMKRLDEEPRAVGAPLKP